MNKGLFEASEEGTPKGGPLSPLLSNIMLNELDKELERRGLPFVRYADDSMIYHLANMKRLLLVTDEWLRQTSLNVVSINTKHTNGVIFVTQ